jgi:site-specific recombinase XerD
VRALLDSIDRSTTRGLRDFSLLYLTAAYGLRSSELVRLTLDNFDWHARTLRVYQPKTRQVMPLPLTDEAAGVLINYLRKARPKSEDRHLFLRFRAPAGPLAPAMVSDALERCRRASGLKLPPVGAHVLRHSFAVRLLRQGVAMKTIGDTLGHRDVGSTLVYLRLGLEDLRAVSLPLPVSTAIAKRSGAAIYQPRQRAARFRRRLPKRFHSLLATALQRFVRLKRTLGCAYRIEAAMLGRWDDFLYHRYPKSRQVRSEMFLNWTSELAHLSPNMQCAYLRAVKSFLQFHARDHEETFIPDALNLPKTTPPPLPRLVSPDEMAHVLDVAQHLRRSTNNPLRAETFRLGLILLFCCGLRRTELLRLTLDHIDLEQSLIRIENTKFHKSRLVPLSPTVANEVAMYLRQRQQMKVAMHPKAFLLANGIQGDKAYADHTLLTVWHRLCLSIHLVDSHGRPPRLHDLRHSFAVNTLQRWYAEGANVQAKLPHLATYLGHVNIASTHYYLKLTPELRQAASQRFHQRFATLFTKGGIA